MHDFPTPFPKSKKQTKVSNLIHMFELLRIKRRIAAIFLELTVLPTRDVTIKQAKETKKVVEANRRQLQNIVSDRLKSTRNLLHDHISLNYRNTFKNDSKCKTIFNSDEKDCLQSPIADVSFAITSSI